MIDPWVAVWLVVAVVASSVAWFRLGVAVGIVLRHTDGDTDGAPWSMHLGKGVWRGWLRHVASLSRGDIHAS